MKIKPGAVWSPLAGLHIEMRRALIAAETVFKAHGVELVVTSGLDGEHSAGSYHYYGLAVDLRTRQIPTVAEVQQIAQELRAALGSPYDVVVEGDHLHLEYDWEQARKGGLV